MQRLLVIEHDPEVRCSLQQILQAEGYSVLAAANGQEGLRLFRVVCIDLVLINLQIPEMDGWELIRQFHLIRLTTKIIAMTGDQENEQDLAVNSYLGDHMMLHKPFSQQTLLELVRRQLAS